MYPYSSPQMSGTLTMDDIINYSVMGGLLGGAIVAIISIFLAWYIDLCRGPPGRPAIIPRFEIPKCGDKGECGESGRHGVDGTQIYVMAGSPASNSSLVKCAEDGDIYIDKLSGQLWQMIQRTWIYMFSLSLPREIPGEHITEDIWTFNAPIVIGQAVQDVTTATTITSQKPLSILTGTAPGNITTIVAGVDGQSIDIWNKTTAAITFDATSNLTVVTAALPIGYSTMFIYDAATAKWVQKPSV
jgi:hypothetical protein